MKGTVALLSLVFACGFGYDRSAELLGGLGGKNVFQSPTAPAQVHIAFAGKDPSTGVPNGLAVSWQTETATNTSVVKYGTASGIYEMQEFGSQSSYFATFDHHVILSKGITPGSTFYYIVGDETGGFSKEFKFTTPLNVWPREESLRVLVLGDMGIYNSDKSMALIKKKALQNEFDFIWHVGDISYADDDFLKSPLHFNYENIWNQYMQEMEDVIANYPYMVLPGNHEAECHSPACQVSPDKLRKLSNFSAYNSRFRMPSSESGGAHNMWYSFNVGPAHFVNLNTETDFPGAPLDHYTLGKKNGGFGDQVSWLKQDLSSAMKDKSNGMRPWILVAGHRQMYSITSADKSGVPLGPPKEFQKLFEPMFKDFGVDLYMCGHVHGYERQYPVYENQPVSNETSVFKDLKAPVHIVNGGAGNIEGLDKGVQNIEGPLWNVVRNYNDFGFGILTINVTTLQWDYFLVNGTIVDRMIIEKS